MKQRRISIVDYDFSEMRKKLMKLFKRCTCTVCNKQSKSMKMHVYDNTEESYGTCIVST